ncbi:hypothetical protein LPJ61_003794 [Coemansia biformis]|uniref:Uncharacterized protein n=1 Tax=Coemansia biformis TaxID=1286918 RepID=A0A9W7YBW7_9FUNG|nr:hypothetical protein LPJ61_003794 [Coemansia biformis]
MESEELGCGGTVACLTLDSHWDPEAEIILGHGAYGSNSFGLGVGIFGSHTTHAWPACAEEIAEKFLDTTAIDTSILANDAGEGGEYWQAANIGMGALFHMAAMAMWIDSGPTGIIQRGYKHFSRAFMAKEPGHEGPIKQGDEGRAHLNRLSAVGLRHHPCLRMPGDVISEMAVEFISATDDGVVIHSKTGVILVEVLVNNKHCTHMEYTAENFGRRQSGQIPAEADEAAAVFPTQIALSRDRLRGLVGELAESDEVVLSVTSLNRDWPQQREIRRLAKL